MPRSDWQSLWDQFSDQTIEIYLFRHSFLLKVGNCLFGRVREMAGGWLARCRRWPYCQRTSKVMRLKCGLGSWWEQLAYASIIRSRFKFVLLYLHSRGRGGDGAESVGKPSNCIFHKPIFHRNLHLKANKVSQRVEDKSWSWGVLQKCQEEVVAEGGEGNLSKLS